MCRSTSLRCSCCWCARARTALVRSHNVPSRSKRIALGVTPAIFPVLTQGVVWQGNERGFARAMHDIVGPMTTHDVGPLDLTKDARACAQMLVTTEPWITLQLTFDRAVARLKDARYEIYAVRDDAGVAAFVVLDMHGLLSGYIQTVCVRSDRRGEGLGTALIRWAEDRIFRDSPNVFICVSSFNP